MSNQQSAVLALVESQPEIHHYEIASRLGISIEDAWAALYFLGDRVLSMRGSKGTVWSVNYKSGDRLISAIDSILREHGQMHHLHIAGMLGVEPEKVWGLLHHHVAGAMKRTDTGATLWSLGGPIKQPIEQSRSSRRSSAGTSSYEAPTFAGLPMAVGLGLFL